MNYSLKTLTSWVKATLVGLAGASIPANAQDSLSHPTQVTGHDAVEHHAKAHKKAAVLYIDYDNIAGNGEFGSQFQDQFGQFLLTLKTLYYPDTALRVKIYGNFAYHFPGKLNAEGKRPLDTQAFHAWKQSLPKWCKLHNTPTRKSKGKAAGKTRADGIIMFGLQQDAFLGHPVALMSNDVDFDYHLKSLNDAEYSVKLFTNKLCHYDLKSALPDPVDARAIMQQSGFSSTDMALSELCSMGKVISYKALRRNFDFYAQNNWQGTGSFKRFLRTVAPMLKFDFSEYGKIRVSAA